MDNPDGHYKLSTSVCNSYPHKWNPIEGKVRAESLHIKRATRKALYNIKNEIIK